MCDSLVILPHCNAEKSTILAKNSDREPDEAQEVVHYKASNQKEGKLKCTYIEIPQASKTHEVFLSKPFQMWGAEMGVNEHGVAIANEAVFTKLKKQKTNTGLTGMDLLRLGLERATTAKNALEIIINLVEKHGQDACGGYRNKDFYYHNSFLIADTKSAYLLETAARSWAWKKIENFETISNQLNITDDCNEIKINDKLPWFNLFKKEKPLNFKSYYSDFFYTTLSRAKKRKVCSFSLVKKAGENISVENCFEILKTHHLPNNKFSPKKANTGDLCMHATNIINRSNTNGSMVSVIRKSGNHTVWFTATPHPCLAVYMPFYFGENMIDKINPSIENKEEALWWLAKKVQNWICKDYQKRKVLIVKDLESLQANFIETENKLFANNASRKEYYEFSEACFNRVLSFWKDKQKLIG